MNEIFIHYPHTSVVYQVLTDNKGVYEFLKKFFGEALLNKINISNEENNICTISILYNQNIVMVCYHKTRKEFYCSTENILSVFFRIIREYMVFEKNWNAYHGACVNFENRNILFLGESGAGKTTLVTYLVNRCNAQLISEDMVIVNYVENKVVPLRRPLFLRIGGYKKLLEEGVKFKGDICHIDQYGIERLMFIPEESLYINSECLIGACVIPQIDKNEHNIYIKQELTLYANNSYLHTTGVENIKSSLMLNKKNKLYIMHYYNFIEACSLLRLI